jgi:hypothetical protein
VPIHGREGERGKKEEEKRGGQEGVHVGCDAGPGGI